MNIYIYVYVHATTNLCMDVCVCYGYVALLYPHSCKDKVAACTCGCCQSLGILSILISKSAFRIVEHCHCPAVLSFAWMCSSSVDDAEAVYLLRFEHWPIAFKLAKDSRCRGSVELLVTLHQ